MLSLCPILTLFLICIVILIPFPAVMILPDINWWKGTQVCRHTNAWRWLRSVCNILNVTGTTTTNTITNPLPPPLQFLLCVGHLPHTPASSHSSAPAFLVISFLCVMSFLNSCSHYYHGLGCCSFSFRFRIFCGFQFNFNMSILYYYFIYLFFFRLLPSSLFWVFLL